MDEILTRIADMLTVASNHVCGYPFFFLLIGGGLFLFIYSGGVSLRHLNSSIKALRESKAAATGDGQISPFQALMSEIASTVGMGCIAGVAIAVTMGGPGAVFWMWVSAIVGMSTKFFEGALAVMYKGKDASGETQGGPMYIITTGLGKKWTPMAYFFSIFGLIGTLCFMQANQLVEAVTTVFTTPAGIENTLSLRFIMGLAISIIVASVILGGIKRISSISSKIVPVMVLLYFILVFAIILINLDKIPGVISTILHEAFNMEAGIGGILGTAIIGARRATYVNEAGVGTASLMHGASRNNDPIREGLITMIGPALDSGLVCTLTAIPILLVGYDVSSGEIKGLDLALHAFGDLLPGYGEYMLMAIVLFFAFSTMFSYSYYGMKCTNFLFGPQNTKYYNYFYLVMIIVAAMIPLDSVVAVMDMSFAFMALPNMIALLLLAPRVKRLMKNYFSKSRQC